MNSKESVSPLRIKKSVRIASMTLVAGAVLSPTGYSIYDGARGEEARLSHQAQVAAANEYTPATHNVLAKAEGIIGEFEEKMADMARDGKVNKIKEIYHKDIEVKKAYGVVREDDRYRELFGKYEAANGAAERRKRNLNIVLWNMMGVSGLGVVGVGGAFIAEVVGRKKTRQNKS